MRFLALINISPEKTREVLNQLKKLSVPSGVRIHGWYGMFGRYDVALWFEAPDEKSAMDLVTEKIRGISGVTNTETFVTREI